jgi:hypothetical protein
MVGCHSWGLHRLFDQGLLAVAKDGTIDVTESLRSYELYYTLQDRPLNVRTTWRQRDWLAQHWVEWRVSPFEA